MYLTFIRWLSYLKVKTPLINKMSKIQGKVTGTDPFIKISNVSNPIILLEIHRYNVFLEFFVLCQTFWILLASSSCLGLFVLKYTPFLRLSRRCIDVGYKIYWNIYKVTTYMCISERRSGIKYDTLTHWSQSLLWIYPMQTCQSVWTWDTHNALLKKHI